MKTRMTPAQYLASLPPERRKAVKAVHDLIRKAAPSLKPFAEKWLGYGPYHYRYASGREGDAAVVGLASQKQYMSLYICAADENGYLPEQYKARIPRADVGKCCIRFKSIEDLPVDVIKEMLRHAVRVGGDGAGEVSGPMRSEGPEPHNLVARQDGG